jgi:hypothetical protein
MRSASGEGKAMSLSGGCFCGESMPGWGLCFCKTCGTTLCGIHRGDVHGVALGTIDGDPGVRIEMHIFVGSKAPWDHIGGNAPQYPEFPPGN